MIFLTTLVTKQSLITIQALIYRTPTVKTASTTQQAIQLMRHTLTFCVTNKV